MNKSISKRLRYDNLIWYVALRIFTVNWREEMTRFTVSPRLPDNLNGNPLQLKVISPHSLTPTASTAMPCVFSIDPFAVTAAATCGACYPGPALVAPPAESRYSEENRSQSTWWRSQWPQPIKSWSRDAVAARSERRSPCFLSIPKLALTSL